MTHSTLETYKGNTILSKTVCHLKFGKLFYILVKVSFICLLFSNCLQNLKFMKYMIKNNLMEYLTKSSLALDNVYCSYLIGYIDNLSFLLFLKKNMCLPLVLSKCIFFFNLKTILNISSKNLCSEKCLIFHLF